MTGHGDREPLVATASLTVGPFFHVGPMKTDELGRMAGPGERIALDVGVFDGDGESVSDAMVELWHPVVGFGRLGTRHDGWCSFDTARPPMDAADRQAPHFSVCLFARGLLRHLYTRIYFEGDSALDGDPILAAVPDARRSTLVARRADNGRWRFVVRLQGHDETVFLDI